MAQSHVTFLFPAFNEAESIGALLTSLRGMDLLVVDDGSTDATAAIAQTAGARVLSLARNHGYDGAIVQGLKLCKTEDRNLVITADADGQHHFEDLRTLALALHGGEALVTGVRDKLPRFGERAMAAYGQLRFGMRDPLCGLKGYDLSRVEWKDIDAMHGSVGSGLAFALARRGVEFSQHDVPIYSRLHGRSRFGTGLRANLRILSALIREVYKDVKSSKNPSLEGKACE